MRPYSLEVGSDGSDEVDDSLELDEVGSCDVDSLVDDSEGFSVTVVVLVDVLVAVLVDVDVEAEGAEELGSVCCDVCCGLGASGESERFCPSR